MPGPACIRRSHASSMPTQIQPQRRAALLHHLACLRRRMPLCDDDPMQRIASKPQTLQCCSAARCHTAHRRQRKPSYAAAIVVLTQKTRVSVIQSTVQSACTPAAAHRRALRAAATRVRAATRFHPRSSPTQRSPLAACYVVNLGQRSEKQVALVAVLLRCARRPAADGAAAERAAAGGAAAGVARRASGLDDDVLAGRLQQRQATSGGGGAAGAVRQGAPGCGGTRVSRHVREASAATLVVPGALVCHSAGLLRGLAANRRAPATAGRQQQLLLTTVSTPLSLWRLPYEYVGLRDAARRAEGRVVRRGYAWRARRRRWCWPAGQRGAAP